MGLIGRQEADLEVTEMRMFSLAMSVMKIDKTKYEYILETAGEERIRVKLRDEHYTGRRVMKTELSKTREDNPRERFIDTFIDDMKKLDR